METDNTINLKKRLVTKYCQNCGTAFVPVKSNTEKYCSKYCQNRWYNFPQLRPANASRKPADSVVQQTMPEFAVDLQNKVLYKKIAKVLKNRNVLATILMEGQEIVSKEVLLSHGYHLEAMSEISEGVTWSGEFGLKIHSKNSEAIFYKIIYYEQ